MALTDYLTECADALRARGGTTDKIPARAIPAEIRAIPSGATDGLWHRPPDRPTNYVIADNNNEVVNINDNEIWILYGLQDTPPNDFAIKITTSDGDYQAAYGVGLTNETTIQYPSGTIGTYTFDVADYQQVPLSGSGYRYLWIRITPSEGNNITGIDLDYVTPDLSSTRCSQIIELYVKCSKATAIDIGRHYANVTHRICDIVSIEKSAHGVICRYGLLSDFSGLQKIYNLDIDNWDHITGLMEGCASYNQPFPPDLTFKSVQYGFLTNCTSYNQPLPTGAVFDQMSSYFLYNCTSFNQPILPSARLGHCNYFMDDCKAMSYPLTVEMSGVFKKITGMRSLKGLKITNWTTWLKEVEITSSGLVAAALVALFEDAPDRTGLAVGKITISYTVGAKDLTPEQRAIITSKNYTLVG